MLGGVGIGRGGPMGYSPSRSFPDLLAIVCLLRFIISPHFEDGESESSSGTRRDGERSLDESQCFYTEYIN